MCDLLIDRLCLLAAGVWPVLTFCIGRLPLYFTCCRQFFDSFDFIWAILSGRVYLAEFIWASLSRRVYVGEFVAQFLDREVGCSYCY